MNDIDGMGLKTRAEKSSNVLSSRCLVETVSNDRFRSS